MKKSKCSHCGKEFFEDIKFCPVCGNPIEKEVGKGNSIKWVFIGIFIALIICVAVFFIFFYEKDTSTNHSEIASQEKTAESTSNIGTEIEETENTHSDSYSYADDYILPYSDTEYLTYSDIADLTTDELCLARNEIYARKGRMFDSDEIRAHFASKDWYYGEIPPDEFSEDMLNEIEKANVEMLLEEEESRAE